MGGGTNAPATRRDLFDFSLSPGTYFMNLPPAQRCNFHERRCAFQPQALAGWTVYAFCSALATSAPSHAAAVDAFFSIGK